MQIETWCAFLGHWKMIDSDVVHDIGPDTGWLHWVTGLFARGQPLRIETVFIQHTVALAISSHRQTGVKYEDRNYLQRDRMPLPDHDDQLQFDLEIV